MGNIFGRTLQIMQKCIKNILSIVVWVCLLLWKCTILLVGLPVEGHANDAGPLVKVSMMMTARIM